ncbi:MAG: hypothetical protein H0W89_06885 [Candidatus Levybacteria bacterium]|nr:hypothetical protein [Candidatus Levybacteria bacterium]
MNIQTYLQSELQNSSQYELSLEDQKLLHALSLEEFLYKKLTTKKFRKWSLDEASSKRIKEAIALNVQTQKPIQCIFPFGGYKLWNLDSAPTVDWAKFFTIAYYLKWIAPILKVYQPGIHFTFSSDDVIVERLDNIPPKDTKAYFDSFKNLLQIFAQHFPANLTMDIVRVADLYTSEAFEKEFASHLPEMMKAYENPEPNRYQKMLATSALNFQWNGVQDFTTVSESEKQKKIKMGPIIHDAYGKMVGRRAFVRGEEKIVVFTTPIPNAIAIGTTKTSVTKFWTGIGVLEKYNDAFKARILSPEQIKSEQMIEEVSVHIIDLKNFQTIAVYPKLHFTI